MLLPDDIRDLAGRTINFSKKLKDFLTILNKTKQKKRLIVLFLARQQRREEVFSKNQQKKIENESVPLRANF